MILVWAAFALCVALSAFDLTFGWLSRDVPSSTSWSGGFVANLIFILALLVFPAVGLLICLRRPGNGIGWLLLAIGLCWGIGNTSAYSDYAIKLHHPSAPAADVVASLGSAFWLPAIGLTATFLFLLFPDGRLPGPRWRWAGRASAFGILAGLAVLLMTPGRLTGTGYPNTENPFGVGAFGGIADDAHIVILIVPAAMVACAASLVVRFRRSHGVERLQLKWLTAAGLVVALGYAIVEPLSAAINPMSTDPPTWLTVLQEGALILFVLIPLAIGVAVLRHRLYDIDVIIRKTLLYTTLLATLAVVYLGGIAVVEAVLRSVSGQSGALAVSLSTLAVAAAFQPLRRRIQHGIDRRFYRSRYDAERAMASFSAQLRSRVDLEDVRDDVLVTVTAAVQPAHASIWFRAVTIPERRPGTTEVQ